MIHINPLLSKVDKTASQWINWLLDNKREHGLEHLKGRELIQIRRNGIDGKCFIHPDLEFKLNEFIEYEKEIIKET